jgi:hypothetical protein
MVLNVKDTEIVLLLTTNLVRRLPVDWVDADRRFRYNRSCRLITKAVSARLRSVVTSCGFPR